MDGSHDVSLSVEHQEYSWLTAKEVSETTGVGEWLQSLVGRAEKIRELMSDELREYYRITDSEV